MLKQFNNLNQFSKINLLLFFRVQQNACSSNIEIINFEDPMHWEKELLYIETILQKFTKDYILTTNEIEGFRNEFFQSIHDIKCLSLTNDNFSTIQNVLFFFNNNTKDKLNDLSWISKILRKCESVNIYILRNEGDFPINAIKIACDCNNCLADSIFQIFNFEFPEKSLKFNYISSIDYCNGYQYSTLNYSMHTEKLIEKEKVFQLKENTYNGHHHCKKKPFDPSLIVYPTLDKDESKLKDTLLKILNPAYEYWKKISGSAKHVYVAAPMIGQSELAFRQMTRKYGAQICFTPMINANIYVISSEYQEELFTTVKDEGPLIVQLAGNCTEILLNAAKITLARAKKFDNQNIIYFDINFGCPQPIGRRHNYGAWLMEDPNIIANLVKHLKDNLDVPISCKIRIFESMQQTIKYAQMLEKAGCSLLTIHGRERKSSMNLEPANWEIIRNVKQNLNIPVVANGGIDSLETANKCLAFTECDGVMAASHLLGNPYLFSGKTVHIKEMALEYLNFALQHHSPLRYAKGHILNFFANKVAENILNDVKSQDSISKLIVYITNLPENYFYNIVEKSTKNTFDLVSGAFQNVPKLIHT